MNTRIYAVTPAKTDSAEAATPRLIRATTASVALRHAARDTLNCCIASQDDIVRAMLAGGIVEEAGAEAKDKPEGGE